MARALIARSPAAPPGSTCDHALALSLAHVMEAAALAAARWVGRGDKEAADQAAVDAMRSTLETGAIDGSVVTGEGAKDRAPVLHNGERVGAGSALQVDVAVDPLEGTTLAALDLPGAISIIAAADRGTMFFPLRGNARAAAALSRAAFTMLVATTCVVQFDWPGFSS